MMVMAYILFYYTIVRRNKYCRKFLSNLTKQTARSDYCETEKVLEKIIK